MSDTNSTKETNPKENYLKFNSLIGTSIDSLDLILAQFESDKGRFNEISDKKEIKS